MAHSPIVATYSIAACDLEAKQWGVAVQSKFLAVGSVVPWAEPEIGAVATQAWANPRYGPDGLALLRSGKTAEEAVQSLTAADEGRDVVYRLDLPRRARLSASVDAEEGRHVLVLSRACGDRSAEVTCAAQIDEVSGGRQVIVADRVAARIATDQRNERQVIGQVRHVIPVEVP